MDTSLTQLPPVQDKRWFLIRQDGHEGPYSFRDLERLVKAQKLSSQQMIWGKGLKSGICIRELRQEYDQELPPPLPIDSLSPPKKKSLPIPDSVAQTKKTLLEKEVVTPLPATPSRKKVPLKLSFLLALIFGASVLTFLHSSQKQIHRLGGMSVNVFEEGRDLFEELAENDLAPTLWTRADYGQIWAIDHNSTHVCEYDLLLKGQKDKILGDQKVTIQSHTLGQGPWIIFEKLQFQHHQGIVPGFYAFTLSRSHCQNNWKVWEKVEDSVIAGSFLLSNETPDEFDLSLSGYKQNLARKELLRKKLEKKWRENLTERLATLSGLSGQIQDHFVKLDTKKVSASLIQLKIKEYTQKFGRFLTALILENEKDAEGLASLESMQGHQQYVEMISQSAQRIGRFSMEFIEKVDALKKPTQKIVQPTLLKLKRNLIQEKGRLDQVVKNLRLI